MIMGRSGRTRGVQLALLALLPNVAAYFSSFGRVLSRFHQKLGV